MTAEPQELPLFPLNTVLFPGMALPLHIFEERYKQMIGRCLERDEGFGVLLIREGREVGEPAEPFLVGTEARIARVERLAGGRLNLICVGTRRFRCLEHRQVQPYRLALVEWLADVLPATVDEAALREEVRGAVEQYVEAAYALADQPRKAIELADDLPTLSYQVGALLQIAASERQALLEQDSVEQRLHEETALLRRETRMLQMSLVRRDLGQANRFSSN